MMYICLGRKVSKVEELRFLQTCHSYNESAAVSFKVTFQVFSLSRQSNLSFTSLLVQCWDNLITVLFFLFLFFKFYFHLFHSHFHVFFILMFFFVCVFKNYTYKIHQTFYRPNSPNIVKDSKPSIVSM